MKNNPLVSVLIPYYNDEDYLKESIEAVLAQTYENFELVLINHASTDGSRDIAHSYSDNRIVHIDMDYNNGAGGGIIISEFVAKAKGEYYKFFCADDIMLPSCLEDMVAYMEENKKKDFIFGNIAYMNDVGKSLKDDWFSSRPGFSKDMTGFEVLSSLLKGVSILPYIGSFVRAEALRNDVVIEQTMIMVFDMSMWASLLLNGREIGFLDKVVAKYRISDTQVSGVQNRGIAITRSFFENRLFNTYLLSECKDIDLIKKLFSDCKYCRKLDCVEDIPFIVNVYYMIKFADLVSYYNLGIMLQDKDKRDYFRKKYGFGVADFRKLYTYPCMHQEKKDKKNEGVKDSPRMKHFKDTLYTSSPGSLKFSQLMYLLLRRFYHIFKHENEYSL